jgi:hypothetical protein
MKLKFSRQIFQKKKYMKLCENRFSGSRVVSRGWTDERRNKQEIIKIILTFSNPAKAPKNGNLLKRTIRFNTQIFYTVFALG